MENDLSRSLNDSPNVKYDAEVKRVLGQKQILAWILQRVVSDFSGMDIKDIIPYIEGNPEIAAVPVNPGETNSERVRGLTNEDKVPDEGVIYYDIRFMVKLPHTEDRASIIVNVEAQKNYHPGYEIVTRGIFYTARMLSSQLGIDFKIPDYDDIKKVYSIWICMDAKSRIGNAISEYSIKKADLLNSLPDKKYAYDKMSVVIITLDENTDSDDPFIGMMNTLLTSKLLPKRKKQILQNTYGLEMKNGMGKELGLMCNLSELVKEQGLEQGLEQGKIENAKTMLRESSLSLEEISKFSNLPLVRIQELKEQMDNKNY